VPKKITVTVFKVTGETNTDDLSPAPDAWSRPDIPLHYLAMLKNARPGLHARGRRQARPDAVHRGAEEEGPPGRLRGRRGGHRLQPQVGHQQRHLGDRRGHPFVPNKRFGGVTLGGKIAPIFFNTQEDSGALPIEVDVSKLEHGRRDRGLALRRQDRKRRWWPSSNSRATCCWTKCAPAAAST
jgi:aconitate hydratase 2/2-methylisocitrate dehydratase